MSHNQDMRRRFHAKRALPNVPNPAAPTPTDTTSAGTAKTTPPPPPPPPPPPAQTTTKATSPTNPPTSAPPASNTPAQTSSKPSSTPSAAPSTTSSSTSSSISSTPSSTLSSDTSSTLPTTMANSLPTTMTNYFNTNPIASGPPASLTFASPLATPSTGSDASPSSNAASSHGLSTGIIVVIAVAALFGAAAVVVITNFIRRRMRNNDDFPDNFDRNSFIRASVVLPQDHTPEAVMNSRTNPVTLARANMGWKPETAEMSQTSNWAGAGGAGAGASGAGAGAGYYDAYPAQNTFDPYQQHPQQQQQDYGYGYTDGQQGQTQPYEHRSQHGHVGHVNDQYAELSRQMDIPAVNVNAGAQGGYGGGRQSPPQGRSLTGGHHQQGGYSDYDDIRSGTPVDANPQHAYHQGSRVGGGAGAGAGGYEDDAYGGM